LASSARLWRTARATPREGGDRLGLGLGGLGLQRLRLQVAGDGQADLGELRQDAAVALGHVCGGVH